jgi:hypothetical protein
MLKSGAFEKRLSHFDTIVKTFEDNSKISEVCKHRTLTLY